MDLLSNIRIVLVEPIHGGNIGSVCRAMNNNGITDLAIVNPRPTTDWDDARKLSCNAKTQLEDRKEFPTLEAAVADCTVVAGASARTGFYRDTAHSPREFAPIALENAKDYKVALVFGREDKGLFNEELALVKNVENIDHFVMYLLQLFFQYGILHGDHVGRFFLRKLKKRDFLLFFPILVTNEEGCYLGFVKMQIILDGHMEMKEGLVIQDLDVTDEVIMFI